MARNLHDSVHEFVTSSFRPRFGQLEDAFSSHPLWNAIRDAGTELWLDTGSLDQASKLWTREFSALTTNNTLLNQEVQQGTYDELVGEALEVLRPFDLSESDLILELGFILNARHGLRLVQEFDAMVSVEEHTDLAMDMGKAVEYGRRYHRICPERFIVKIPFTSAGLLATRRLSDDGIPVNHTLGFSARQNYLIARFGRPAYVNVFLGRLNAFAADNGLGDGAWVGEKAVLASQRTIRELRKGYGVPTRQIGASFRSGAQVRDLAGIDVMTLPPKVATEFLRADYPPGDIGDRSGSAYEPVLKPGMRAEDAGLDSLWTIPAELVAAVNTLEQQDGDRMDPTDLEAFLAGHGCADLFPCWTPEQVETSRQEGKIPKLQTWQAPLDDGSIGLDSLMNLAGLNSFREDQLTMDERIRTLIR